MGPVRWISLAGPGDVRPGEVRLGGIRPGRARGGVVVRGGRGGLGRRELGGRRIRRGRGRGLGLGERILGGTPVRIVEALLDDLADLVPRRYQLEHAAVDLPVPSCSAW